MSSFFKYRLKTINYKLLSLVSIIFLSGLAEARVKNVILFIGDGMGEEHLKATAYYFYDQDKLSFQQFPYSAKMRTESYQGATTDSAAAATAMATGVKTLNGYVGRDPSGLDLENITYLLRKRGVRTGIVTDASVSHATPAGFSAHADQRDQLNRIVDSLLSRSRPNVIFGGALEINPEWAAFKGYEVIEDKDQLRGFSPFALKEPYVSGQFGEYQLPWAYEQSSSLPRLPDLAQSAIEILAENNEQGGFFVMIEAAKIDWGSHAENLYQAVYEVRELERAVDRAINWAKGRDDTLILVTADHETGGLEVLSRKGIAQIPDHKWTGPDAGSGNVGHTSRRVPVYAWGAGSELFQGEFDNTEIFYKLKKLMQF